MLGAYLGAALPGTHRVSVNVLREMESAGREPIREE